MYTIYVKFACHEGKREAFVNEVRSQGILDAIRAEDGCLQYDYYYADEDKNGLLLIEAWESKQHQQIHMEQPHMARLREINKQCIRSAKLGEFEIKG